MPRIAGRIGALALVLALWGCDGGGPRLLYGYFARAGDGREAVLVFDRAPVLPAPEALRFDPPPAGTYACAPGGSPGEVRVVFDAAAPFPDGAEVKVFLAGAGRRSPACVLRAGRPHPVLVGAVWRDTDGDRIVDAGDELLLAFDGEVALASPGGGLPLSEIVLAGRDRLARTKIAAVKAEAVPEGVRVTLGEGVFLRPGRAGAAERSEIALNGTPAAPSRAIVGKDSGLGAVSIGAVPLYAEPGFAPFRECGALDLGPAGGNLDPSVTFAGRPGRALAVIAGGYDRTQEPRPAADVFVIALETPAPPLWVGTLLAPRGRHAAVALPPPPDSSVLGAVLFVGGDTTGNMPARRSELLVVGADGRATLGPLPETAGFPAEAVSPPRRDPRAVYVPEGPEGGLVVVAGGDPAGFIGLLEVRWRAGAEAPEISSLIRNWREPLAANRSGHTLTVLETPGGERAVFLFGGKITGVAGVSSVAAPLLLYPRRAAAEADAPWAVSDFGSIDERNLKREGHAAEYLPAQGKVVLIGGEVKADVRDWQPPWIESAIEFNPADGSFLELREALSGVRIDPALAALSGREGILVLGGRDGTGELLSTVDVYVPYAAPAAARCLAFGGSLPEEALGAHIGAVRGNGAVAVYLVGGKGRRVWELRL